MQKAQQKAKNLNSSQKRVLLQKLYKYTKNDPVPITTMPDEVVDFVLSFILAGDDAVREQMMQDASKQLQYDIQQLQYLQQHVKQFAIHVSEALDIEHDAKELHDLEDDIDHAF